MEGKGICRHHLRIVGQILKQWRGTLEACKRSAEVVFNPLIVLILQPGEKVAIGSDALNMILLPPTKSLVARIEVPGNQRRTPPILKHIVKGTEHIIVLFAQLEKRHMHVRRSGKLRTTLPNGLHVSKDARLLLSGGQRAHIVVLNKEPGILMD